MAKARRTTTRRQKGSQAAPTIGKARARWRMVMHSDGNSQVAERVISPARQEREQAMADFYGGRPFAPTGERLLPVASVLAEVLSRLHIEENALAPELLAGAWHRAVGDYLAAQAQLISLANGVAGVRTSHPAVRFELQRNSRLIIQRLNTELGEGSVRSLRVHHG